MKKISEYKNEDAIELLADIFEPTAKILGDRNIAEAVRAKKNRIENAAIPKSRL